MQIAIKGITLFFFSCLLFGSINAQEIDLTDRLILHLPMDGDAIDYSGNEVPTIVGGPHLTEDRFGTPDRAYQFDGVDDSININNSLPLITSRSYTICLWVKFLGKSHSRETTNVFFEQRNDITTGASSTLLLMGEYQGELVLFMRSSASSESFKAQCDLSYDSQWHHFVARVDEQMHMEIYLDARLYCEHDFGNDGDFVSSIDHVNLGTHHHTGGVHGAFNGIMDDVYIYNRALNLCEIEAIYSGLLLDER
jgi:hypothetical protein